jgi:ribosomal protein S12 methylthiotransferase accessory factor YcaO
VGTAAHWAESPADRAYFELLERVAVLDAVRSGAPEDVFPTSSDPARWTYARSNGVALHTDWKTACTRAGQELAERDRLQRAWLGEIDPVPISFDLAASPFALTCSYEWRAYAFPAAAHDRFARDVHVVGIFGFPTRAAPLVFGYGARMEAGEALLAATREAAQVLAFLWGEPLPDRLPEPAPTPMAHLESFQHPGQHRLLRRWLDGDHRGHRRDRGPADETVRFVDLTPPWLAGHAHVVKALCASAIPLTFGRSPVFAHLPAELQVHPIP